MLPTTCLIPCVPIMTIQRAGKGPLVTRLSRQAVGALVLIALLVAAPNAMAVAYTFTPIAQTGSEFDLLTAGTINDAGTVAYTVSLNTFPHTYGQQQVLTKAMDGTTRLVTDTAGGFKSFLRSDGASSAPQLNDSGAVAVDVFFDDDAQGVVLIQNGVSTTVADNRGGFDQVYGRLLNNSGRVAYQGTSQGNSARDLYAWDGSVSSKFAGPHAALLGLNDLGQVGYVAESEANVGSLYFGTPGSPTLVAQTGSEFLNFRFGDANNAGTLAFSAMMAGDGQALYSWRDGDMTLIANTGMGFSFLGIPALNDQGSLVFQAADQRGNGIFEGSNPTTDRIIGAGSSLLGSTIAFTQFAPNLNSSGQFVFLAQLTDGRQVLVRADPLPEPATISLLTFAILLVLSRARKH